MGYNHLETVNWGTAPVIPINVYYDYRRNGKTMEYAVKVSVSPINGYSWFGYRIRATIWMEGAAKADVILKNPSPSQWNSNIEYETGWHSVGEKTSGTSSLAVRLWDDSGSGRDITRYYNLTVTPAMSELSLPSVEAMVGSLFSINIDRKMSEAYHRVDFIFNGQTHEGIVPKNNNQLYNSYNFPESTYASQITGSLRNEGILRLHTWASDGTTYIGYNDYTIYLNIPDYEPSRLTNCVLTRLHSNNGTINTWYDNSSLLGGIQDRSTIKFRLNYDGVSSSDHYSQISEFYIYLIPYEDSLNISYDDKQLLYSSSSVASGSEITASNTFSVSGDFRIKASIKDNRGKWQHYIVRDQNNNNNPYKLTIIPYISPRLIGVSSYRSNNSGTKDLKDGQSLTIKYTSVEYTDTSIISNNINLNTIAIYCQYKTVSNTTYNDISYTSSGTMCILNITGGFSKSVAYNTKIYVSDKISNAQSSPMEFTIPVAITDFNLTPWGLGLGKYHSSKSVTSRNNTVESAWEFIIGENEDPLTNFIIGCYPKQFDVANKEKCVAYYHNGTPIGAPSNNGAITDSNHSYAIWYCELFRNDVLKLYTTLKFDRRTGSNTKNIIVGPAYKDTEQSYYPKFNIQNIISVSTSFSRHSDSLWTSNNAPLSINFNLRSQSGDSGLTYDEPYMFGLFSDIDVGVNNSFGVSITIVARLFRKNGSVFRINDF